VRYFFDERQQQLLLDEQAATEAVGASCAPATATWTS
jgi:hypothetical protein